VLIFATLFGVGFLLLIGSLIFGHDTDVDADVDMDVDTDASGGAHIFSIKMISLLMVGFGAFSFGVRSSTAATMFVSSMAGIGGAILVGIVGYVIIRMFYSSQASSTITNADVIGSSATLIDGIAENGIGQASCVLRGREITYLARSRDGGAIKRGTAVRIITKTGNIVIVEEEK